MQPVESPLPAPPTQSHLLPQVFTVHTLELQGAQGWLVRWAEVRLPVRHELGCLVLHLWGRLLLVRQIQL